MKYDFDNVPSRVGTYSFKFDFAKELGHAEDEIPMWVADMDFPTVPAVVDAINEYSKKGFFGYSDGKEEYFDAVIGWFKRRYGVEYQPEWLSKTPGVVCAFYNAVACLTKPGDSVLINTPVYYPFIMAIEQNDRKMVTSELLYNPDQSPAYTIDYEDFENKIVENDVKMFIMCSPHNPVGRVWTPEELQKVAKICLDHNVLVVVDEIHCDLTYPGVTFTPMLKACPELKDSIVVCTAPSKTFSLAGLQCSNIWIPNKDYRDKFRYRMSSIGINSTNILGIIACAAAYNHGEEWLEQVMQYIQGNLDYVRDYLATNVPKIKLVEPQGTYLIWLDCSELGMEAEELNEFFQNKCKLWLDPGSMFGGNGGQFQRINLACPRSTVVKAMDQIKAAVDAL